MDAILVRPRQRPLHPVNAFSVSAAATLFFGALLSDLPYAMSGQVQWTNFASWLIAAALVGFINALIHAKDAWAVMPEGLVLSAIVVVLACVAAWMDLSTLRMGDRP